jgi:hypothetical protein
MLENKADVPVSAPQTQVAQLEATIRSAHALLQAGLVVEASNPHAAYTNDIDTDRIGFISVIMFCKHLRFIPSS